MQRALLKMIEQPARCGGENIDAVFEIGPLFPVPDSSMDYSHAQIGEASIIAKRGLDLRSQFARWLKHEATKFSMPRKPRQNWQGKRRRLAGACLRGADQIFARQNNGKGAELDRGRLGETHRLRAAHDFRRKSEIIK